MVNNKLFSPKLILLLLPLLLSGCNKNSKIIDALELSKRNRKEFEKVLNHYKTTNQDISKLKAAQFLIENMPFHYSIVGNDYSKLMTIYQQINEVPVWKRDSLYKACSDFMEVKNDFEIKFDIQNLSAQYLIKTIDQAFETFNSQPWNEIYKFNTFCKYILPYRIANEDTSSWRKIILKKYKKSLENLYFDGGEVYEAEKAKCTSAKSFDIYLASGNKGIKINSNSEGRIFYNNINSYEDGLKYIIIWYFNGGKKATGEMIVNKDIHFEIEFKETKTWSKKNIYQYRIPVYLNKGVNTIEFKCLDGTIILDNIEVAESKKYDYEEITNITSGGIYRIINKKNGNLLSLEKNDTLNHSYLKTINDKKSNAQLFTIVYTDYGFFSFFPNNIHNFSKAIDVFQFSKNDSASVVILDILYGTNQKWAIIPIENGNYKILNKNSGKCLDACKKDKNGNLYVLQNTYKGKESQKWKLEFIRDTILPENIKSVIPGSAIEAAFRLTDLTYDFDFYPLKSAMPDIKASLLIETKAGICRDETHFVTYLSRGLGLPVTIDFVPQWPFRDQDHHWNVIFDENNKATVFHIKHKPGYPTFMDNLRKAKVFRHVYKFNENSLAAQVANVGKIPELFKSPFIVDVTKEYTITNDLNVPISGNVANMKCPFVYLCVFDNKEWVPVHWGKVKRNQAFFESMGRNVVYLPQKYENDKFSPVGEVFLLDKTGNVCPLAPEMTDRKTVIIKRKYPYLLADANIDNRINGGRFQGSNDPAFLNAKDMATFNKKSEAKFYEIEVYDNHRYKYLRYLGPDGSFCNINEIVFFDENGDSIKGEIIGTPGSFEDGGSTIEKVFDNNILTGYKAKYPNDAWVGLKLGVSKQVSKIRFIPRNDGNCIEPGDIYQLVYWDNEWKDLGIQKASSDSLIFENVPDNVLLLLHNHTKGKKERIFTYKNGKQVWW